MDIELFFFFFLVYFCGGVFFINYFVFHLDPNLFSFFLTI